MNIQFPLALSISILPLSASLIASEIALFDFQDAWQGAKEPDFATFAGNAPSVDTDAGSVVSELSNNGFTSGGYASFTLSDEVANTEIFTTSTTMGLGMNMGGANQTEATNYFSFTVTPEEGAAVTYGSLTLFTSAFGGTDTYNVELRAIDGEGEETVMGDVYEQVPEGVNNEPVSLATFDFEDFTSMNVTEWRIYVYNTDNANWAIRFDDITFLGPSSEGEAIEVSDFSVADGFLSLTWKSSPGKQYSIRYSTDLEDWSADLDDGVAAEAGETTSVDYELALFGLDDEERLFVRVEEE
jgi:hypothetical protein